MNAPVRKGRLCVGGVSCDSAVKGIGGRMAEDERSLKLKAES
jgi:hypothetical protein